MRVVFAVTKYPPAIGGHELHIQQLAEGLRARDIDVRVVTSDLRRHRDPVARLPARDTSVNGVPVLRLPATVVSTRDIRIPRLGETLVALEPDVLHASDVWSYAFRVAVEVANDHGVPLLLNPVFHDRSSAWTAGLRETVKGVPRGATTLFETPWEEQRLGQLGCRFPNTDLLPPAVDLRELAGIPDAAVPGVPADKLLVSFVGRVTRSKGVDVLLDAFAQVASILAASDPARADRLHLVVAGFIDSDERFEGTAHALEIADRTTFLYDRPRGEIVNLLRASRLVVLPSRAEAFGIVVLEAWATGNLVVVSDRTALPYVVEDGLNGIVSPLESLPDALLRGLRMLDTPDGERLVSAGATTLRQHYLRRGQIDHLVRCLGQATAGISRRRD